MSEFGESGISPPASAYEQSVLGWAQEAISEGRDFLKSEFNYDKIDPTIKAIMSVDDRQSLVPGPLSTINVQQLGKIALDLRSGLTDTKIFWEYRTANPRYEPQAVAATKRARSWWLTSLSDMVFADAISWCFAAGSCPVRLVYNREKGEMEMQAWDPRNVLPVRLSNRTGDYNDGFGVVLVKENTVNDLKARYPKKAEQIKADRDGAYSRLGTGSLADKIASVASPLLKGLFSDRQKSQIKVPSCESFTIEVKDDSVNHTGHTVLMGPEGANWSYTVEPNQPLYPRGRVIVTTRSCVLYDGPNPYWHGKFDVLKLTLDQWPFSFLGKSPLWDLLPLQDSLRTTVRLVANHVAKLQRPGLIADKNSMPKAAWDKLDTALPGLKAMQNPSMGKGMQVIDAPPLDPMVQWYIGFLIERMEFISGSKDIANFAKLGQVPSSETIEKMLEAMSPAIRSRSRTMEAFFRNLAPQVLSGFMQFDSMQKTLRMLGTDGLTLELFDHDPGVLIPDYVHADDLDASGTPTFNALARGPKSRMERAVTFMPQFEFYVSPGSLLKASEVTQQLLYLQLARAGYIDAQTLLERLGIQNVTEIMKRLTEQAQLGIGMAANSAGRKATGQSMPQMRGDGKISESG